jgi:hypothetical protein
MMILETVGLVVLIGTIVIEALILWRFVRLFE